MKTKLRSVVIGVCLLLAACAKGMDNPQPPQKSPITSYGPDKDGVKCYINANNTDASMSCVYVGVVDE